MTNTVAIQESMYIQQAITRNGQHDHTIFRTLITAAQYVLQVS
jgi:hypothetical protein